MNDMRHVTEPKSDQWNFDDFQAGPLTFTIEAVKVKPGQEQPVEITLAGTPKFYRPCKSMSRCLVAAWGADSSKYVGRSLTLYGDPKVKWGGLEVGGIRISHMSDIDSAITMALTVTRANKKPFTVKPIVDGAQKAAPQTPATARPGEGDPLSSLATSAGAAPSQDEVIAMIAAHVAKAEWNDARDLARSIRSESKRAEVIERIGVKEATEAIP